MKKRFYQIEYRDGDNWALFSETEYTTKEANSELKHLNGCGSPFAFRKKFIYSAEVVTLSARS